MNSGLLIRGGVTVSPKSADRQVETGSDQSPTSVVEVVEVAGVTVAAYEAILVVVLR
jgi:hypothetical protein